MSPVFVVLAVTVGVLLLWGLVAPRRQWRALVGWSMSDPHANEPSTTSYVIRGLLFLVGLGGVLFVTLSLYLSYLESIPEPPKPPTAIEEMWGSPDPSLVNRVVLPLPSPPGELVETPVLGYQERDEDDGFAGYFGGLRRFALLGDPAPPGMIGVVPSEGFSALDTAELVVQVRGDLLCIPRAAVVVETETTVQIAIYFGLPDRPDLAADAHATACAPEPAVSTSILLPVELGLPVGDRDVQFLDGTAIQRVPLVE